MTQRAFQAVLLGLAMTGCGGDLLNSDVGSASEETSSTCSPGYHYAGYKAGGRIPAIGSSVGTEIKWNGTSLYSGETSAYASVQTGSGTLHWIQAGIKREYQANGGLRLYIEYDNEYGHGFKDAGPAVAGTAYHVRIIHAGAGVWTASINGVALGKNVSLAPSDTYYSIEAQNTNSICNHVSANFSNTSYTTSSMYRFEQAIYRIDDVTSNGWRAY
jgi:hypothetical protein